MSKKVNYIVFGVAMFALGWFGRQLVPTSSKSYSAKGENAVSVVVTTAKMVEFNPPTEYVGHIEPEEATDILPQIDGYIKKVCFAEGAKVSAGDLLFEIDREQYDASRNLRYSEVRSAEAKVEVAKSDLERAERYYRRLTAADNRGITATEMDNAEMALSAAKATLNSAVAAVEQAKASAAIAEFNLKHTKVFSPISGRIGKALHHVGDYVSPSKSALAHVVKLDPIRVVFPITDRDYDAWQSAAERRGTQLNASRRFRIRLPNGEEYAERGIIEFGDNEMSRETGTLVMYVSFPNPSGRLVPNAFVRVLSDEANPPRVLAVPSGAVVLSDDGARVWTVDGENKARSVSVEIGKTWNGVTLVKSGLSEGDKIVSSGAFKLKEGASLVCHEGNEVR